jgi:uncharacterized membrane protein
MTTINKPNQDQRTLLSANTYFNQKNLNFDLNLETLSTESLKENIYFISPHIYDLLENNLISLNTAKLKAKNMYNSFSKPGQKLILNKLLQLKIHNNFQINKLDSYHIIF